MKNIVVITGSPRKGGNSELLAKAFREGAEEAGHNVFLFETRSKKLSPCTACNACFRKGRACSVNDDFNELAPVLENADTIVFSTPLYWFTFPAHIKMIIDKLYAFNGGPRPLKIKEAVLLVCAETDDIKDFDGIVTTYQSILDYKKWENAGILKVPNVNYAGDVRKTDALDKAKEMGELPPSGEWRRDN
ncbi:MAG: flavodoxin family protein [Spirochaetaceae bacterium]|jgi:multimeric flavodoxin WrbA|nr:flavodoxin family protein [Spirochaetaceae bacterium]